MAFWGIEVKAGKPVTHSSNNERGRLRISQVSVDYYTGLLGGAAPTRVKVSPSFIQNGTLLTIVQLVDLVKLFTGQEVKSAIFKTNSNKSPGPGGYGSCFSNATWDIVGEYITEAVMDYFQKIQVLSYRMKRSDRATLGIGNAETKSLVQCNVGNKSPVFLCALLPNKTESCHLDLEFEEAEDVVFSVLGPRTVYLTGYYVGNSRQANVNSDTESYGEDIADTETGESCHDSEDDKYDDSFINDSEPEISPPSPASSSGGIFLTPCDHARLKLSIPNNNNGGHKRLRKKYQVSESENEDILQESDDEDNCLLSALKKKTDVKAVTSEDKQKNDIPHRTENGGTVESKKAKQENSINSKKKRKQPEGNCGKLLEENTSSDRKDYKEDITNLVDVGLAMTIDMKDGQSDTLEPLVEEDSNHVPKLKKRKHSVEVKSVENHDTDCAVILKEDQLKQDPLKAGHLGEDPIAIAIEEEDQKLTINNSSVDGKSDSVADGHQSDKKLKKKKKKKTKSQDDCLVNKDLPVLQENEMNRQSVDVEDKSLKVKSTVIRTLSNGLTIEELAVGEPGGKLAAPGKKIKVHYTGRLKENGQIFYTNMGKSPYKFRLGDKDVIEGWNLGLTGMRVGDKRRLTVPPSIGYGSEGAGENIPPNSWLVFDIELIGVRG
ncbi:hypothetical protein RDI58_002196 [Solanum bulbocastanum]|uniref:peptidylprolyl isomerase n=1 Tax=Solanum bulbocastanum TaxID=147425 RepID=A0AAN8U3W3_SOLBU